MRDLPEWLEEITENLVDERDPAHRDAPARSSRESASEPLSLPVPMQLGASPKSKGKDGNGKGKGKDVKDKGKGKDGKTESSKKAKCDDQREFFYCSKTGHLKAECRKRLKDLAGAEGKPVAATPHPSDTTTACGCSAYCNPRATRRRSSEPCSARKTNEHTSLPVRDQGAGSTTPDGHVRGRKHLPERCGSECLGRSDGGTSAARDGDGRPGARRCGQEIAFRFERGSQVSSPVQSAGKCLRSWMSGVVARLEW